MPKFKTFLLLAITLVLALAMIGCGMLTSRGVGPETAMVTTGGELPEWLTLAHRTMEGPGAEDAVERLTLEDIENSDGATLPSGGGVTTGQQTQTTQPAASAPAEGEAQATQTESGGTQLTSSGGFGSRSNMMADIARENERLEQLAEKVEAERKAEEQGAWWNTFDREPTKTPDWANPSMFNGGGIDYQSRIN